MHEDRFHVVIAGGGVAALEASLALHALAGDAVTVELVAPETEFTYRPLSVAEPFRTGEVRTFPLRALADATGAKLRRSAIVSVDADRKVVTLTDGDRLSYDALLLAVGAEPVDAVGGALTFRGPADIRAVQTLLERATRGDVKQIAFAVPSSATWPLPLYELALMTANYLSDELTHADILVLTPEDRPLSIFGPEASKALSELLEIRGIHVEPSVTAVEARDGRVRVIPDRWIDADAVVALPRLEGTAINGIPQDDHGFVSTDEFGWVLGLTDVYAAGDITTFPLKQGGIATQQADAAASAIAADAGANARPHEFRPVLRGLLLTGLAPRFLRAAVTGAGSTVDTEPLWWPPAKIVGRYLAPFLAAQLGLSETLPDSLRAEALPVDIELDRTTAHPIWTPV